ncbi:hypothetical protein A2852_01175 [Candidatus Adlerbacteria bacterium RIFCSPHIGHO2_01_FULL_54_23]|uniref:Glycosyl transferase family 1 domain-containing protein n=3 Tax=Candidatus Adleribacteriota TaxID=1752736 RepID=A0A1F4Y0G6_9BACT|nr:MAG: Glycosyltransferase WecB/TagA/CpsF family protein [Candidatus Adlerbacteria bacterium GW2011_GWA1_54_10]KKW36368.1 MAG: Glycosyltransferase WecB/TagA/CpsF family protein [Candidatus Adlerbacteria bacterium GW2011_GWA2_54_12]KKW37294.1 MAG: Glycosyltransferase WecB/TagA/CpsF family protein [Candidatus Adlerbacteria bacterium GW2011_GWB1_54_7]OGC78945.1 MAG: hypothetical protein A2852_01175 [Candidatus Adlerbacteria bacterium RIFCSPHIGHO2_01_FULL_54_23]OGC87348.1 MAG: hypothetical protein
MQNKLKILFFINGLEVGGAERVFVADANALQERGFEVHFASFVRGPLAKELVLPAERVHETRSVWSLARLLHKHRIQILYTTLNEANAMGRLAALFAPGLRLYTRESNMSDTKSLRFRLLDVVLGWRSTRIIAVSRAVGESLARYAPHLVRKITLLYNGVPVMMNYSLKGSSFVNQVRLLCVASLTYKKDQAILLRALALLPERYSLTLIGDGSWRGVLENLAKELKIESRVRFLGSVPYEKVVEEYKTHDIFVLPSQFEGCPNVVSEAQSFAMPTVAFDIPGMREFVSERSGILVKEREPQALAAAIEQAAANAAALGQSGFEEVRTNRSQETHLQKLMQILGL